MNKAPLRRPISFLLLSALFLAVLALAPPVSQAVLEDAGPYMRVYYLSYTRIDQRGSYSQIIFAELPGDDGILGTEDDVYVLYDGGNRSTLGGALEVFLDEKIGRGGTIHHMVLSHRDADHVRGLTLAVNHYRVLNYYENYRAPMNEPYLALINAINAADPPISVYYYQAGDVLSGPDYDPDRDPGPGWDPHIEVKVLAALDTRGSPGWNPNDDSGVLFVRNQESAFLWGGDATGVVEEYLLDNYPDELAQIDIFQVHHHGADTRGSNSSELFQQLIPQYSIIPITFRNSTQHPYAPTLDRLNDTGSIVYRNDLDYHITVLSDSRGNYEIARGHPYNPEDYEPWTTDVGSRGDLAVAPPPFTTGLNVTEESRDRVVLEWDDPDQGDSWLVFRSSYAGGDPGAGWVLQTGMEPGEETGIYERLTPEPIPVNTFTDISAIPGTRYYYRVATVRSYTENGFTTTQERRWSNEVSALRPATTPIPTPSRPPTPPISPTPVTTPVVNMGPIRGRVYDRVTGQGIPNVYVRARSRQMVSGGTSDRNGYYTTGTLIIGTYEVFADTFDQLAYRDQYFDQKDSPGPATWVPSDTGGIDFPLYRRGVFPTPLPMPTLAPTYYAASIDSADFDGDGTSDLAIFRPSTGLWAVRGITRAYFGRAEDIPVPGDYTGDGTSEIALFRAPSGLWVVRGVTRAYFGRQGDIPIPGDYRGFGFSDFAVFRPSSGLWAVRGLTRLYFGRPDDIPVPLQGGGWEKEMAVFRPSTGLWAIRGATRFYFGQSGDIPLPGNYQGLFEGAVQYGVFRPSTGLWAIRGVTRVYFGNPGDVPHLGNYRGLVQANPATYRRDAGLWAIRGLTRVYFGGHDDLPVSGLAVNPSGTVSF